MYSSIVWIPHDLLNPGVFFISSAIFNHLKNVIHLHERDILMFAVHEVFDQGNSEGAERRRLSRRSEAFIEMANKNLRCKKNGREKDWRLL